MKERMYLISGVGHEELLRNLTSAGASIIGEREYLMTYLKNTRNESDLKAVVHYENKYLDFDPDFPEDPKIRVMVGDPRNRESFVDCSGGYKNAVENLENQGFEEFSCSTSTDYDVVMPRELCPSGSYEIFELSHYVIGNPDDAENYPYSISAVVLTERSMVESVIKNGEEVSLNKSRIIRKFLTSVLGKPVEVSEIEREIITALDVIDVVLRDQSQSTSGEDE